MEANNFDIQKMSQKTGIPVLTIQMGLSIPLDYECKANTPKEAKESYNKLPAGHQEKKSIILEKWKELFLSETKKATSLEDIGKVYEQRPPGAEKEIALLEKKWDELFLSGVRKANTLKGLAEVSRHSPPYSKNKTFFLEKWNRIFLSEVKKANTPKELKEIYWHKPIECQEKTLKVIWKKWIRISATRQELLEAKISFIDYYHDPDGISREDVEVHNLILGKEISLFSTIKELDSIYHSIFPGRNVYTSTKNDFCQKWIDISTTDKEILNLYNRTSLEPKIKSIAITKLATLYGWKQN